MPFILSPKTPDHFELTRSLNGDEIYAAQRFLGHITHCARCASPHKTLSRGDRLCSRGASHAQNIARYMGSKKGVVYSNADQKALNFTKETEVIRELFIALEKYPQTNVQPITKKPRRASVAIHNHRQEDGSNQLLTPPASPSLSSNSSPRLNRSNTIQVAQSTPKSNRTVYRGLYSYYSVVAEPSRADRRESRTYHSSSRSRSPPTYHR